jgi:transposase-like protein
MGKRGRRPSFVDVSCPNEACELCGISGRGNITSNGTYKTKSGRVRKFICHACGRVFCSRTNTALYDLRTEQSTVELALKMAMKGMSVLAIGETLKIKPKTVSRWIERAAEHTRKVDEAVIRDVDTPKMEMDEAWTFVGKKKCPKMKNSTTMGLGPG